MMMNDGFEGHVKDLFSDQTYIDIKIVVDQDSKTSKGTVSIPAHRLVLATMSDYFRTMLYGQFIEANKSEIRLFGVPNSTFQHCLRFMYFGWDTTLENMSLDEGMEFYSLARMLLMESKLKETFSEWIANNVSKWEKQLWTIFVMADECDLPVVSDACEEHFTDVANEFLINDTFRTIPLSVIKKVIACEKMNCTKLFLIKAIRCWISHNSLDIKVKNDLLDSVRSKKAPFFKGKKAKLYDYYPGRPIAMQSMDMSAISVKRSYSSSIRFRKCIMLTGISVILWKPDSKQYRQIEKGAIDLKVDISSRSEYDPFVSRIATVTYDFTHGNENQTEVFIFFPQIKVCADKLYTYTFSWIEDGIHPEIYQFGKSTKVSAVCQSSYVASVYRCLASELGCNQCETCRPDNDSLYGWRRWALDEDSSMESDYS
ncbi:uncharacterized protein LOC5568644 isoform X2 [Aedes aegypti]|uniref:BTB domain-containing protein n=1 Tax=Aedes aegypti TaxID=7159 RepID=A0A6I8TU11_AEDAE|nr:uncharacterized protein LOC5568644 isoform X2 [Aedes aegypti]XP_021700327.1 uncharacterized protein LOC5568644 isoform X2 [Aedes aegypti]